MYIKSQGIDFREIENTGFDNKLFINNMVWNNSQAKGKMQFNSSDCKAYDYVYTELAKNLDKEVNRE